MNRLHGGPGYISSYIDPRKSGSQLKKKKN